MSKIDYRAIRMSCDACGDTQDFEPYSTHTEISDAGWSSIIVAKYGAARYGEERDLCAECGAAVRAMIKQEMVEAETPEVAETAEAKEVEEGDACAECGAGKMEYERDDVCSCHISPPCYACVNTKLTCTACGWRPSDETSEVAA